MSCIRKRHDFHCGRPLFGTDDFDSFFSGFDLDFFELILAFVFWGFYEFDEGSDFADFIILPNKKPALFPLLSHPIFNKILQRNFDLRRLIISNKRRPRNTQNLLRSQDINLKFWGFFRLAQFLNSAEFFIQRDWRSDFLEKNEFGANFAEIEEQSWGKERD